MLSLDPNAVANLPTQTPFVITATPAPVTPTTAATQAPQTPTQEGAIVIQAPTASPTIEMTFLTLQPTSLPTSPASGSQSNGTGSSGDLFALLEQPGERSRVD